MFISELDVDDVNAGLCWLVCDAAGSILVVMALNVRLARAFDGEAQTTITYNTRRTSWIPFPTDGGCSY